jgi:hypothetical protein
VTGSSGFPASLAPLPLSLPLLLLAVVAIGWWSWNRSANPPRFWGYAVRVGWMVDPIAWLDRDLRQGLLGYGIGAVLRRLLDELTGPHRLTQREIYGWFGSRRVRSDPVLVRARASVRRLGEAYRLANLAEDPGLNDLWSRWRRPARRARARAIFEEELRDVRQLWPRLEASR